MSKKNAMKNAAITHLFLDIGGVLLTNGWDHHARKRAAINFKLKFSDIERWHHLIFEIYEKGKITLEEYLNLETAVQGDKVMQGFESESFLTGGDHSQMVKAPPVKNDCRLKRLRQIIAFNCRF